MNVRNLSLVGAVLAMFVVAACSPALTYDLVVDVNGNGGVVSDPPIIDAPDGTSEWNFASGVEVTLTASPDTGYTFDGFSFPAGASYGCEAGSGANTCVVTMNSNKTVTASFSATAPTTETLTVDVETGGTAAGEVTSAPAGIDTAGGTSSIVVDVGDSVELTATATAGAFAGWTGGDCDGQISTTCTVTVNAGEPTVTANFNNVESLEIAVAGYLDDAVEFLDDSNANAADFPDGWIWSDHQRFDLNYDPDHAPVEAGLRFENVSVPADARVQSAKIRLTAYDLGTGTTGDFDLTISGQAALNPASFPQDATGSPSSDITSRTSRTAATTAWTVSGAWTADTAYETPSVTTIVEEIIGQAGWESSTQSVVFFLSPNDTASVEFRRVHASEDGGTTPTSFLPTLLVEYVPLPTP